MTVFAKITMTLKGGAVSYIKIALFVVLASLVCPPPAVANGAAGKAVTTGIGTGARVVRAVRSGEPVLRAIFPGPPTPSLSERLSELEAKIEQDQQLARDLHAILTGTDSQRRVRGKRHTYAVPLEDLESLIPSLVSQPSWPIQPSRTPEEITITKLNVEQFLQCVEETLSPPLFSTWKSVVVGFSYKETAEQLGISEGTVGSRVSNAKKKLRDKCRGIL